MRSKSEIAAIITLSILITLLIGAGTFAFLLSTGYIHGHKETKVETQAEETETNEIKGIEYVDFSKQIVVDENTHILYIGKVYYGLGHNTYTSNSYAYLCPYYSENGKKQKLVDGKIIELDN